eukprot:TRINITY_DN2212_c0_g1_i3.p1 TRINITY_DN2212_c0_g1~~TRINITY_DN2212_c0_g1_i3.p1  ORF type:complete len:1014 (+),score=190.06 TRINITY_DN2212_c0_g1_i3:250-3291(+)
MGVTLILAICLSQNNKPERGNKGSVSSPMKTPPKAKAKAKAKTKAVALKSNLSFAEKTKQSFESPQGEERYGWLINIRDENGNPPDSPNYDPSTLYIPPLAYHSLKPFEQQFWDVKKKHFDTVVFFKKGKFFELYEMDADIGHKEFDLKMTDRVNMRMVGVPESSFADWASKFLARGYKITKVEQKESSKDLKERRDKGIKTKKDDVIQRGVAMILTPATLTDPSLLQDQNATYLLAIKEEPNSKRSPSGSDCIVGICFVDTAVGEFNVGEFEDDVQRSRLETLLLQTKPKHILYEKGMLSKESKAKIWRCLGDIPLQPLQSQIEFWTHESTLVALSSEYRITSDDESSSGSHDCLDDLKQLAFGMSAFGACLWYLKYLMIDKEVVPLTNFKKYDPYTTKSHHMMLDGQTLQNLEILANNRDGATTNTLLGLLDLCKTAMGKRLLRRWVCFPLTRVEDIENRLDCVDSINSHSHLFDSLRELLSRVGDIERLISRAKSRALSLSLFLNLLDNLMIVSEGVKLLRSEQQKGMLKSKKLNSIIDAIPDLDHLLLFFTTSFDSSLARCEGYITPVEGTNEDYDVAVGRVQAIEQFFENYLTKQKELLGLKKEISVKYTHREPKDLYQIEIPKRLIVGKKLPEDYRILSETKDVKRFHDPVLMQKVPKLIEARDQLKETRNGVLQYYQDKFSENYALWKKISDSIAELDALMSLSHISSLSRGCMSMCRPKFIYNRESPVFKVRKMWHPFVPESFISQWMPNDVVLGEGKADAPSVMLLTGPNMGGKSSLMRQVCMVFIMAQLGCYVPAEECIISPADRIFTRIGANDDIMAGQSTFMVELSETSNILKGATPNSLVILDELGRGTSTFDGYSIAYGVLSYLAETLKCRTIFSTHYHMLTDEFASHPKIALHHMSCAVDKERQRVVYLYTLAKGTSEKSYGMNVALVAGVPETIVASAEHVAQIFQVATELCKTPATRKDFLSHRLNVDLFSKLMKATNKDDLQRLLPLRANNVTHK